MRTLKKSMKKNLFFKIFWRCIKKIFRTKDSRIFEQIRRYDTEKKGKKIENNMAVRTASHVRVLSKDTRTLEITQRVFD